MKYVFHPAALSEYGEAVKFYAERKFELAQAFINAVEDAWAVIDEDIRYSGSHSDEVQDYILRCRGIVRRELKFSSHS